MRYSRNGQRRGRAEKRRKERERKWANGCEEKKMARRDVSKLEMPSSTRRWVREAKEKEEEEKWKRRKEGKRKKIGKRRRNGRRRRKRRMERRRGRGRR